MAKKADRILRESEVQDVLRVGRMTLFRLRKLGVIKARRLPGRRIGYLESEVQAYIDALPIAGIKDDVGQKRCANGLD